MNGRPTFGMMVNDAARAIAGLAGGDDTELAVAAIRQQFNEARTRLHASYPTRHRLSLAGDDTSGVGTPHIRGVDRPPTSDTFASVTPTALAAPLPATVFTAGRGAPR